MPFLNEDTPAPLPVADVPRADPIPDVAPPGPDTGEVFGAAFRLDNAPTSVVRSLGVDVGEEDVDHKPVETLGRDSIHVRDYLNRFTDSINEEDTLRIKEKIDQEVADREIVERSGATGVVATLAAGLLDPINLIPGGSIARSVKGGISVLRTSRNAAGAGATAAAVAEGALQATQETRTVEESVLAIGGSAILSGVVGGGAAALLRRTPEEIVAQIERDMTVPAEGEVDTFSPGGLGNSSVGAAQVLEDNTPKSLGIFGKLDDESSSLFVRGVRDISPVTRLESGPSIKARRVAEDLAESVTVLEKAARGVAQAKGGSVETRTKLYLAPLSDALEDLDGLFLKHRFGDSPPRFGRARAEVESRLGRAGPDKLDYKSFKEQVAIALRNGDEHALEEVTQAARILRKKVYDPLKGRAIELGLLPEDVDVTTALSYLNRVYDKQKIRAQRGAFKAKVLEHLRSTEPKDGRSDLELDDLADEIIERIIGTPDGRLPYDAHLKDNAGRGRAKAGRADLRGPLQARVFNIPDNMIQEFLENDIEFLARAYTRTMSTDVELAAKFGDVELTTQIKEVTEEFNKKIGAAKGDEKLSEKLQKQKDAAVRDIAGIRDRLRGTYSLPEDPDSILLRAGRVVRSLNYLRLLGGMTVSAIPDLARTVMVHGLSRTFSQGLVPLIKNFKAYRSAGKEVKMAGTALDMMLDTRAMAIADIMDDYGRHSKFERALHGATSSFGVVTLMAPWNAALKQFSGMVTMSRILENAKTISQGGKLGKGEVEALARAGIDESMAKKIWKQFSENGGEEIDGSVYLPNTEGWVDAEARTALRGAVVREVDKIVVTPGQERPLFMSKEGWKLITQFKSFAVSSTQRTLLAGLQQRDAAALNGALLSMVLGGLSYSVKQHLAGREVDTDPRVFLAESFDRSGLPGWFMEPHNLTAKLTRGQISLSGKPLSRYASRNIVGALMGPSAGLIKDMATISGDAFTGEFDDKTVRSMRRLGPYQNVFWARGILNKAEQGAVDALGVPKN